MDEYCNLHVHSQYSLLDGYGSSYSLVKQAQQLGQTAIGITDHGNMSAILEMKQACDDLQVKLVPGSELYIAPWGRDVSWRRDDNKRFGTAFHLTVWAYNQQGYSNLLKLTQLANKVGFYYTPRIDYGMLEQYNEGLIITSGCMSSATSRALNPESGAKASDYKMVNDIFSFMVDIFGVDRYYIELQDHDILELREINLELSRINEHYGFQYLATNDSHYPKPEDADGQADILCVNAKCSRLSPNDFVKKFINHSDYFLTTHKQMINKDYGFDVPFWAFTNTSRVADMVEPIFIGYEKEVKQYRFPIMPEYQDDYNKHLYLFARAGLSDLYGYGDDMISMDALERFHYEIEVIKSLGFASYFLCVYDISRFCIEEGIPMTVRGSAGGSIILYCLGVTDFCPLEYNLIFERFLNPDRVSAPDADLDIDGTRRNEVIQYVVNKYGKDFVAQVCTFSRIKGRGAIRDAARLNEADYSVGDDMVSRMIDGSSVAGAVSEGSELFVSDFIRTPQENEILKTALRLEGQIRSIGIHAGALMLSNRPLVEDYPLIRPKTNSKAVTKLLVAIDYESAEQIGGIKLDLLNVDALGILYEAMRLINERHGKEHRFDNIPVDDPVAYDLINSGNLAEIFQLSGYAAKIVTGQIKPRNVKDIMAINAIARPGPLQYAQQYADRFHGRAKIEYKHPDLAQILEETQGIMIYQEQVMRISQIIAGFTGGQADILRKAVSKKKGFNKIKVKFIEGGCRKGYDKDFVVALWDDILHFAGYGFNASHACAYARIAVKLAYLKALYPIEFYAAAMTGRAKNEGKLDDLLKEMTKAGIKLLPPRLGYSHPHRFTIDDEERAIRYPYTSVKNVGKAGNYLKHINLSSMDAINVEHLKWFKKASSQALETLAMVGAFDHLFGNDRNEALNAVPYLTRGLAPVKQMSFIEEKDLYTEDEFLAFERRFTGLYLTGHPLSKYNLIQPNFSDMDKYENMHKQMGVFVGVVNNVRLHRDKNGNLMAFITIEDMDYNEMSVIVFASLYAQIHEHISAEGVIKVLGKIDVRYGDTEEEDNKIKKYGRVSIIAKNIIGE